jgi:hypothetical protein
VVMNKSKNLNTPRIFCRLHNLLSFMKLFIESFMHNMFLQIVVVHIIREILLTGQVAMACQQFHSLTPVFLHVLE